MRILTRLDEGGCIDKLKSPILKGLTSGSFNKKGHDRAFPAVLMAADVVYTEKASPWVSYRELSITL